MLFHSCCKDSKNFAASPFGTTCNFQKAPPYHRSITLAMTALYILGIAVGTPRECESDCQEVLHCNSHVPPHVDLIAVVTQ